jgi:Tol biopolymer transport system component
VVSFTVSPDGARAAYVLGDAIYVTAWPAQPADPKKAAVVVKAGKVAVKPSLLMSDVAIFGDTIFYFRREPKEQKRGWIEAWDLAAKKATTVFELPEDYPMWNGRFLWSSSRKSVLFQHDASYGRGDVYEVALADLQAKKRFGDVHRLLDVSPDGRWVLYAAYTAPDRGDRPDNPEVLVVFDLERGTEMARAASGVPGARFEHAYFVAPAP